MNCTLGVIGVGNMARAIINGIQSSSVSVSRIFLYDKSPSQYDLLKDGRCSFVSASSIKDIVTSSDYILLSVKPQNFPEILSEISNVSGHEEKIYITIAAGITASSVSESLGGARVVRVLPNLPMTIGMGVSVICRNDDLPSDKFEFVKSLFDSSGNSIIIDESEMNRMIGVTSSSPAYVFLFVAAMHDAALSQGLSSEGLVNTICDVIIGSCELLKQSDYTPAQLASMVASKGGTTERALAEFKKHDLDGIIQKAMCACTARAEELGSK